MNPELPNNPREELELRITALLLGELSADEAAVVRKAIAKDAELTKLHDDLKQTIVLVREASSMKETVAPQAEALKLSEERRQKLLTAFKIPPLKEKDRKPKRSSPFTLLEAMVVIAVLGLLTVVLVPNLLEGRTTSQRNSVVNNLRQLDGAKQQWALENNKPADAQPTFADIQPYMGRSSGDLPSPVAGEKYVLGKVGESPSAVVEGGRSRSWFGARTKGVGEAGVWITLDDSGSTTEVSKYTDVLAVTSRQRDNEPAAPALSRIGGVAYSVDESGAPATAAKPVTTIELPALAGVDGETSSDKAEQIGLRFRTWGEKSDRYPARKADGDIAAVAALKTIPKGGTGSGGQGGGGAGGSIPGQTDSGRNVVSFNPSTGAPTRQSGLNESIIPPARPPDPAPTLAEGDNLQTRVFHVDPKVLRQALENAGEIAVDDTHAGAALVTKAAEVPRASVASGRVQVSKMGERVPVLGDLPTLGKQFKSNGRGDIGLQGGINGIAKSQSKGAVALSVESPGAAALDESIPTTPASEPASVLGIPAPQESSQVLAYSITGATKDKEGKASDSYRIAASSEARQKAPDKSNRATSKNWSIATNSSGAAVARYYTGTEREQLARKGDATLAIADGPKNLGEAVRQSVAVDALGVLPAGQNAPADAKTYAYLEQKRKVDGLRRQLALSDYEASGGSASPLLESDLYRTYEKQAQAYTERYATLTNKFRKSDSLNASKKGLEKQIKIAEAELDSVNDRLNNAKRADNARGEETQPYFEAKKKLEELGRALVESQSDPAPPRKPATNAAIPQPEIQTSENNFSTFSLNVSDVSFKLAAASLEKGQMPDAASIRSEEFINAFDYRDAEAKGGAPIAFAWERARYPFAHNRDLLRFSLKTAAAGRQVGRPLNIVLLLDNSGSMERADRVLIRREALRVLASQLQPQDKLSVITFARTARLVVGGVAGDKAGEVLDQVSSLTPEGGTNLEEAMNLAYQIAAKHYLASGINRVVLLTDGAANLGEVEPSSLKQKVEAQRKQGIALDCFGIGWEGFNDDLLEVLSRNGDGRYGFLNSPEEAATDFAGQLAGALKVAASDVKVQVEFNPKRVTFYRQIGYAKHQLTKEQFRDNTVDAAEIAAQEAGNALYTVESNPAGEGPLATVRVRYKVPGTTDYREQSWDVPFTGNALSLEQSSPAMRLAASASAFSEWLVASPFAGEVKPDALLGFLRGVPEVYGADARPKKLEWMIRQAKSVAGQ